MYIIRHRRYLAQIIFKFFLLCCSCACFASESCYAEAAPAPKKKDKKDRTFKTFEEAIALLLEHHIEVTTEKVNVDKTKRNIFYHRLAGFLSKRIAVGIENKLMLDRNQWNTLQKGNGSPHLTVSFKNLFHNFQEMFSDTNWSDLDIKIAFYKFLDKALKTSDAFLQKVLKPYLLHKKQRVIYEEKLVNLKKHFLEINSKLKNDDVAPYEVEKIKAEIKQLEVTIQLKDIEIEQNTIQIMDAVGCLPDENFEFSDPLNFVIPTDIDSVINALIQKNPEYMATVFEMKLYQDKELLTIPFIPSIDVTFAAPFLGEWGNPKDNSKHLNISGSIGISIWDENAMRDNNEASSHLQQQTLKKDYLIKHLRRELNALLKHTQKSAEILKNYRLCIKAMAASVKAMRQYYRRNAILLSELIKYENDYHDAQAKEYEVYLDAWCAKSSLLLHDSLGILPDSDDDEDVYYIFSETTDLFQEEAE